MRLNGFTLLVAAFVAAVVPFGSSRADTVLNLDALNEAGITIQLAPGTYTATPISGLYNAWNGLPGTTTGCDANGKNCQDGYTTRFEISSPSLGSLIFTPPEGSFLTELIALENKVIGSFTLAIAEGVRFRVYDNPGDYPDNIGGLSLAVSPVPLPAPLLLLLSALSGIGFVGWLRARRA
jgi:hypothetical protein